MQERLSPARDVHRSRADAIRSGTSTSLSVEHDFRNMLQLAWSSICLARRQLLDRSDPYLASTLSGALEALERANLLAHRLCAAEQLNLNVEPLLIQAIVPGLRTLLKRALGGDIRLEISVAGDLPPVLCDRLQLENVLLNLVVNAKDAIPGFGQVVIEAVRCPSERHPNCIALSVSDTGSGMSPEVAAQAFRAFFTTKLADGGSGIGLYNVRSFVQELGGSAELSTKPNCGTSILLHLPVMDETSGRRGSQSHRFD